MMDKAVLVVEDEALIRFVAVDTLEDEGYKVFETGSALEALGTLSNYVIDVVFTDVNMPGGSGIELAMAISRLYPKIGILVTSGRYHIPADQLPRGAIFLPKPYKLERLGELVSALMPSIGRRGQIG